MMVSKLGRHACNGITKFSALRYRLSPNTLRAHSFSSDRFQFFRQPSAELWRYIERENKRSLQLIDSNLRLEIEREIQKQSQVSIPELGPRGRHYYSSSVGSDNCLRYSKSIDAEGNEEDEILNINLNTYELRAMSLSVDETFIAYLIVSVQSSEAELWIKDLRKHTIRLVPSKGENISLVEWGPLQRNGRHSLFFTSTDAWRRPSRVLACVVDDDYISEPAQVYHNSDESVVVDVQRTKGCRFVAISATTKVSNEIHLMSDVSQPPLLVRARQQGVQYHIDVGANGDVYLLVSTDRSSHECGMDEELTLFRALINELPLRSGFGAFVAGQSDQFVITDMDIFRDAVVLYERSSVDVSHRIRVKGSSCESVAHVPHQLNPCGNMFYDANVVQFTVESPVHYPVLYEYDFREKALSTSRLGMSTMEAGYDKYAYVPVLVPSYDGIRVPMSLFHRSDIDPFVPENRVVLIGYGAYGEPGSCGKVA
ncbi:serine-type exopeptidase [Fragilaria crotonensis]|nr:serine-type exopeptidase [Fragilaria crotonensis]